MKPKEELRIGSDLSCESKPRKETGTLKVLLPNTSDERIKS